MTLPGLESFFNSTDLPKSIQLTKCELVTDVRKFVDAHLGYLKANPKKPVFLPYWDRLIRLHDLLKADSQAHNLR